MVDADDTVLGVVQDGTQQNVMPVVFGQVTGDFGEAPDFAILVVQGSQNAVRPKPGTTLADSPAGANQAAFRRRLVEFL